MERYYHLTFDQEKIQWYSIRDGYQALENGLCACAVGYATDGEISAQGLYPIEDDQDFFQASNLAIAVRTSVLSELPGLEEVLQGLSEHLTQDAVTDMNHQLVIMGQEPAEVAKDFWAKIK
ncbi:MAG: hypothetical protein A2Y73_06760 [Chloroflexi bacterium RBG_13_56_8]|nr:MAG: hypothetical protein A2Y73_06760 [Chloroflexi bacterium RBG_13_56_8]